MEDLDDVLQAVQADTDSLPGQFQMLDEGLRELKRELQALTDRVAPNSRIKEVQETLKQLSQEVAGRLLEWYKLVADGNLDRPAKSQEDKVLANSDQIIAQPESNVYPPFDFKESFAEFIYDVAMGSARDNDDFSLEGWGPFHREIEKLAHQLIQQPRDSRDPALVKKLGELGYVSNMLPLIFNREEYLGYNDVLGRVENNIALDAKEWGHDHREMEKVAREIVGLRKAGNTENAALLGGTLRKLIHTRNVEWFEQAVRLARAELLQ